MIPLLLCHLPFVPRSPSHRESKAEGRQLPPQPSGLAPFYRSGEPLSPHAAITSSATSLVLRPKFDLIPWSSQLICLPNPSGCRSLGFAVDFALCSILPGLSDRLGDPPSLLLPQTGGGGLGVEVERLLKPVMLLSYYNAFSTGPLPVCLSPAASVPTLLTPS